MALGTETQAPSVESTRHRFLRLDSRLVARRIDRTSRSGLTGHMHTSRRRRFGLPRWLLLTVVAGAVVALAFVNFFAH